MFLSTAIRGPLRTLCISTSAGETTEQPPDFTFRERPRSHPSLASFLPEASRDSAWHCRGRSARRGLMAPRLPFRAMPPLVGLRLQPALAYFLAFAFAAASGPDLPFSHILSRVYFKMLIYFCPVGLPPPAQIPGGWQGSPAARQNTLRQAAAGRAPAGRREETG